MSRILVTGAAGFVGAHVAAALTRAGHTVVACDNFNTYYEPRLKHDRVSALLSPLGVEVAQVELADVEAVNALFARGPFATVVHLAAQAGVRYSIQAPMSYVHSNLVAFTAVLEAAAQAKVPHVLYASSSSVYGARSRTPFVESDRCDQPVSMYAATKQANESIAHAYAHIHGLALTGLRFFTLYGPWGRPDMAYFSFAQAMRRGQPIKVFAKGELQRDFTFIDDAVDAMLRLVARGAPPAQPGRARAEVFNLGHQHPVTVNHFLATLEDAVGVKATVEQAPMQPGDVPITCADPTALRAAIGGWTDTPLALGLTRFARWLEAWDPLPGPGASASSGRSTA